jgi:hypothetical protein
MAINKRLHFKQNSLLRYLWAALLFIGGCNSQGVAGAVSLGEPIITSGLNQSHEPIDDVKVFDPGVKEIYCFLAIRGPENVKMFVRWYFEDKMILEQFIDFGKERKAAPSLIEADNKPLPSGEYRCEFGVAPDLPLRSVSFRVRNN